MALYCSGGSDRRHIPWSQLLSLVRDGEDKRRREIYSGNQIYRSRYHFCLSCLAYPSYHHYDCDGDDENRGESFCASRAIGHNACQEYGCQYPDTLHLFKLLFIQKGQQGPNSPMGEDAPALTVCPGHFGRLLHLAYGIDGVYTIRDKTALAHIHHYERCLS